MLNIEATKFTPAITLNKETGILEFTGRSSPENSMEFYSQVMSSLDEYFDSSATSLTANFNLEYFNTSSLKCIFQIFQKIADNAQNGAKVEVNWYYEEEDDDMLETGEEISEMVDLEFNFIDYSY